VNQSTESGPFLDKEAGHGRLLSDREFDEAVARLQAGEPGFTSPEMLRRLGDTIVEKLWEGHEQPAEPD